MRPRHCASLNAAVKKRGQVRVELFRNPAPEEFETLPSCSREGLTVDLGVDDVKLHGVSFHPVIARLVFKRAVSTLLCPLVLPEDLRANQRFSVSDLCSTAFSGCC